MERLTLWNRFKRCKFKNLSKEGRWRKWCWRTFCVLLKSIELYQFLKKLHWLITNFQAKFEIDKKTYPTLTKHDTSTQHFLPKPSPIKLKSHSLILITQPDIWHEIRSLVIATFDGWRTICTRIQLKHPAPSVKHRRKCTVERLNRCARKK